MQNEPQLSAEMEKRFDEEFCLAVGGGLVYKGELPNGGWMDILVKHFLATALEEQKKQVLSEVEEKVKGIMWIYEHQGFTGKAVCETCREVVEAGSPCKASKYYEAWKQLEELRTKLTQLKET